MTCFYSFDDLLAAAEAIGEAELVNAKWQVGYITQAEYAGAPSTHGTQEATSFYDGQLVFVATFDGMTAEFNPTEAAEAVLKLAKRFGDVHVFNDVQTASYPNLQYRCEYFKISAAKAALRKATKESPLVVGVCSTSPIPFARHRTDILAEMVGVLNRDAELQRPGRGRV